MMFRALLICWLVVLPSTVWAQERDRSFIAGLLEDSLGGEGRDVQIFGFSGALSSRATIERITISDADGVWLTMDDLGLQWARSALLRGRIDIQELSAGKIELARPPVAPESDLPAAEAAGFALPDLPVSIEIASMTIAQLVLGAPVLGENAELSLNGSASLAGGGGAVAMTAQRIDGTLGELSLEATFAGDTEEISIALNLTEAEGGIAARLLELPDRPSVALRLNGEGKLNDLTTNIILLTDGEERLSGDIALSVVEAAASGLGQTRRFEADLGGDVTALFAPQYRPFFGTDVQLDVTGELAADGALQLEALDLKTDALNVQGRLALNRDYWPTLLDIDAQVGVQSGEPVLLPLSGPETYLEKATLRLDFNQSDGENWRGQFDVRGLERDALSIGQTTLTVDGILNGNVNAVGKVTAAIEMAIEALDLGDPALNAAAGTQVSGQLNLDYVEGQPLKLRELDLSGTDYTLNGQADIGELAAGFETDFDLGLTAADLSRFSAISGQNLSGAAQLVLKGTADLGGSFDLSLSGLGENLAIGQTQADAVLAGQTQLSLIAKRDLEGTRLEGLDLRNPQFSLSGDAQLATGAAEITFKTSLTDTGLVVPGIEGPLNVSGTAVQDARGISLDVDAEGPYDARATIDGLVTGPNAAVKFTTSMPEIAAIIPDYKGPLALDGAAKQSPDGWLIDTSVEGPYDLTARVSGRVTGTSAPDVNFKANLPNIRPFVPQYEGAVALRGTAQQLPEGWQIDTDVDGPFGLTASVDGRATGENAPDVNFSARLPDINPFVPGYRGAVSVAGTAQQLPDGLQIDVDAQGPYGLTAAVKGRATGENAPDVVFNATLPDISPLAPQYSGAITVKGAAKMEGETLTVMTDATGPYGSVAQVSGTVTGSTPALSFSARMPNVAPTVPQLSGPLQVEGTARQQASDWFVDTAVRGPAGTTADVVGRVGANGNLGLGIAGNAPLALANPFLAPRNLQGQARFNLRVDGPPSIGSVSGQINTSDGRLAAPTLGQSLNDISADISLSSGRATIAVTAAVSTGGSLSIRGPITMTGALPAALEIGLSNVQLVDPALYRTTINGAVQVNGNLSGGARIAGRIDVGETHISVPTGTAGGFSIIPQITHIRPSAAARATQARAGLLKTGKDSAGPGVSYPLDVTVSAPARIFVRGRGLDAELGGSLRITGTTADIISAGRFELIRGRLDILEKRFVLDEGSIQLQGNFDPFLRFVATTPTEAGTASIIIEGLASEPRVRFESSPEAPEDEVLAQIFFGRQVTQLSAFQALQLASSVATLTGNGGEGVVSKLRRSFDLDDLDIITDAEGKTALTAGKYITDNVYTDVTVGGANGAEVSINIDLTPSLTVRGSADSVGDTSIGIYFEKDY